MRIHAENYHVPRSANYVKATGLMFFAQVYSLDKDSDGNIIRKAGIMGIVLASGEVKQGDPIRITYPPKPF